jgi:hypothetical protein
VLSFAACAFAASQPPTPRPTETSQQQQEKPASQPNNSANDQKTTTNDTTPSQSLSAKPADSPSNNPAKSESYPAPNDAEWWLATLPDWLMAIFAIVLAVIAYFQWQVTERQAEITRSQNAIVETQNTIMEAQNALMLASAEAVYTVERAYVSITHRPPGLDFDDLLFNFPGEPVCYNVRVSFLIKNTGNTPATITGFMFQPFLGALPPEPSYDGVVEIVQSHLTKDDSFAVHQNWRIPEAEYQRSQTQRGLGLYVFGYVDYIDKFGGHHRTGYGRRYRLQADDPNSYKLPDGSTDAKADKLRNNLEFVATPGYNYDKKRKKGEGNDWDEPPEYLAHNHTGLSG